METTKNETTKTQQEMVGRIVLKLAQIKLPMDLMAIEDVVNTSLMLEEEEAN